MHACNIMQIGYIVFLMVFYMEFFSETMALLANPLKVDVVELESGDGLCLSLQRKEKEFKRLRRAIYSAISNAITQENLLLNSYALQ